MATALCRGGVNSSRPSTRLLGSEKKILLMPVISGWHRRTIKYGIKYGNFQFTQS